MKPSKLLMASAALFNLTPVGLRSKRAVPNHIVKYEMSQYAAQLFSLFSEDIQKKQIHPDKVIAGPATMKNHPHDQFIQTGKETINQPDYSQYGSEELNLNHQRPLGTNEKILYLSSNPGGLKQQKMCLSTDNSYLNPELPLIIDLPALETKKLSKDDIIKILKTSGMGDYFNIKLDTISLMDLNLWKLLGYESSTKCFVNSHDRTFIFMEKQSSGGIEPKRSKSGNIVTETIDFGQGYVLSEGFRKPPSNVSLLKLDLNLKLLIAYLEHK